MRRCAIGPMGMTGLALLVLAAVIAALPLAHADKPASNERDDEEPFPIVRVYLPAKDAAKEIERLGSVERMPLPAFNDLLRQATRASVALKSPPRLVAAVYSARLQGESLTGNAHWKIVNPAATEAFLPVTPLNLALLKPPHYANRPALLAEFKDGVPSLLLDAPGEHAVMLDWSIRGDARPGGLRFDLRFPPAVASLVELDLPVDRSVSLEEPQRPVQMLPEPEAALLSGPHPADTPGLRRWRISCPGRAQVSFRIRSLIADRIGTPVVLCRQETTQVVNAGSIEARYRFHVEAPRHGVNALTFECDPALLPCDVSVQGPQAVLSGWEAHRDRGGMTRVSVRLAESVPRVTVTIDAMAPLKTRSAANEPVSVVWTSPGMRAIGVVAVGEELELKFDPDLRLDDWQPGDFRLMKTDEEPDRARLDLMQRTGLLGGGPVMAAVQDLLSLPAFHRFSLVGGGVADEGAVFPGAEPQSRRPSVRLSSPGVQYRVQQLAWWRVRAAGESLTVRADYEVTHGTLERLPLLVPWDWDVETVDVSPPGLLRSSRIDRGAGRPLLVAELTEPLRAADRPGAARTGDMPPWPLVAAASPSTARLTVRLHPRQLRAALTFPDTDPYVANTPPTARRREGGLGIEFDEQSFRAVPPTPALGTVQAAPAKGPWDRPPILYYPYTGQALTGTLTLKPRAARIGVPSCATDVYLAGGRIALETRLTLEAEAGASDEVVVAMSDTAPGEWEWRPARGGPPLRAERVNVGGVTFEEATTVLSRLAAVTPLDAAGLALLRPRGERWRLTLPGALRGSEPLTLIGTRTIAGAQNHFVVPLPSVVGAERFEGEVLLHLTGGGAAQLEASGLREIAPESRRRGGPSWRAFRYDGAASLELRGWSNGKPSATDATVLIDHARLTTYLGPGNALQHHFAFQAANWPGDTLPVVLPAGARPVAAQVDGEILSSLVVADMGGKSNVLRMPVPVRSGSGDGWHRFEVVYVIDATEWNVWARADAPAPELPAVPIRFRRSWRMPPGVVPLTEATLHRVPGPGELDAPPHGQDRPSDLFRLGTSVADWRSHHQADDGQAQDLADAVLDVRPPRNAATMPLGEAIRQMAEALLKRQRPLIVDAVALREARIWTQTPLPVADSADDDPDALWSPVGLVTVLGRSGPVLTTRRQAELWNAGAGHATPLSDDLENALATAVREGHDGTGRFAVAHAWLRHEAEIGVTGGVSAGDDDGDGPWSLLSPGLTLGHWTEWEPATGAPGPSTLIVVRQAVVTTSGLGLMLALLLIWWRVGHSSSYLRWWALGVWLAGSGTGLSLLPAALRSVAWWPFLAGCAVALMWFVIVLTRAETPIELGSVPRRPGGRSAGLASTTAAILAAIIWHLAADRTVSREQDRPASSVVYLVPGAAPDEPIALVPSELHKRLRETAQPVAEAKAVLLSATYDGKVVDGAAQFDAVFQAYSLGDGAATLVLPLESVFLIGDFLVDARPVRNFTAVPNGFAVPVVGRGPHKVEVSFRVAIECRAGECGARFLVPRLQQCRLSFRAPRGASNPLTQFRFGRLDVMSAEDGPVLGAELGRVSTVNVLWHEGARTVPERELRFRESYLWNLRAEGNSLTANIRYEASNGVVRGVNVDLPPELDVRDADVVAADVSRLRQPVRLSDWRILGDAGKRTLRLEFQNPVGGLLDVRLELVPRSPLGTGGAPLPLPSPRGVSGEGYLAYRIEGVDVQPGGTFGVTKAEPLEFAGAWPTDLRPQLGVPTYSCKFKRDAGKGPELKLRLRPRPPAVHAVQEVVVRAAARHADVRVTANLSVVKPKDGAGGTDLVMVEWELPVPQSQFTVLSVSSIAGGPAVLRWSQSDARLQVWLKQPANVLTLEFAARLTPPPGKDGTLELPSLRVATAQTQKTTVRLSAQPGLNLTPVAATMRNLQAVDSGRPNDRDLVFTATQTGYGGIWNVRPAVCEASAKVLTVVETRGRQLTFNAVVSIRVKRGDLQTVHLRLRDWDSADVKLSVPATLHSAGRDRTWTVELPPGVKGEYRLSLNGAVPLAQTVAGVWAPDVSVIVGTPPPNDAARRNEKLERWLAVAGRDLVHDSARGLTPVSNIASIPDEWRADAKRLVASGGSLWTAPTEPLRRDDDGATPTWKLRLLARDRQRPSEAVAVFLGEQSAVVADGRHWLHEAAYWLRHEANAELNLVLPAAGRVVAASVDGVAVTPVQRDPTRLWLPLPGRPGVRRLRVRWIYDTEDLSAPILTRPTLDGARDGPTLWTVHTPDGFETRQEGGTELRSGLAHAAALDLYRAAAQLEIVRDLTTQVAEGTDDRTTTTDLAAAQRRFYQYCRQAEHFLAGVPGRSGDETGPDGLSLSDWRTKLESGNRDLPKKAGKRAAELDDLREDAERQSDQVRPVGPMASPSGQADGERYAAAFSHSGLSGQALPERGTSYSGQGDARAPAPQLQLLPTSLRQARSADVDAGIWLALIAGVWTLSLRPTLLCRTRALWPELLVLLGLLGWFLAGPHLSVLALLLAWGVVRLVHAVRFARRLSFAVPTGASAATPRP